MCKEDGTTCLNSQENAEVFKKHFQKLYGKDPSYDNSVINLLEQLPTHEGFDSIPTDDEIINAVKGLRNKAPGDSGITPRMIKAIVNDNGLFSILKSILIDFWENELPPQQWEVGLLKILPKKGDLTKPGNYRGIMLLEIVYKVVAKLTHSRLQPIVESLDHEAQCGFRPGRGCADAVFSVKIAMKKRREHGLETWILFLDLVKAFDRVPRQLLWDILRRFGVPQKLVSVIESLHRNMNVKFTIDGVTHSIKSEIGVKQGDILGPILFTIFIAAIMISWRQTHDRPLCLFHSKKDFILTGRRPKSKGSQFSFDDSEYADDTAVLFESRESLEEFTQLLINHFARFGMEVHTGDSNQPEKPPKTEVLFVSAPSTTYKDPSTYDNRNLNHIQLDGDRYLPVVKEFRYLGTLLSRNCKDDSDVISRINKAGNAFGALRKCIFGNRSVNSVAKKSVYEGLILSILLYGSESWCITEKLFNMLRVFHNRCVRATCNVTIKEVFEKRITTN